MSLTPNTPAPPCLEQIAFGERLRFAESHQPDELAKSCGFSQRGCWQCDRSAGARRRLRASEGIRGGWRSESEPGT